MSDDVQVEQDDKEAAAAAEEPAGGAAIDAAGKRAEPSAAMSKRKWHDRKWLLVTIVAIAGLILGVGMAAPDRQAAEDEAKKILTDAKRDAEADADELVEDAEREREELLGDAEDEKEDLLDAIETAEQELKDVRASIRTATSRLAATEKTRAAKQKQVDRLNRAIRSSTSLSRENAVQAARDYLDYSSFSCQGLIDQLSSEYGSQFSVSDATYAAKQVGLC